MEKLVGMWVTTTKQIGDLKEGCQVRITGYGEKGYDVITANNRAFTACGEDFFDKDSASKQKVSPINTHIKHLCQMGLLRRTATKQISAVRAILETCKDKDGEYDEYKMSRLLHDVWTGNKTLKEFIAQYGRN